MRALYRLQSLLVSCLTPIFCCQPASAQWTSSGCSPTGSWCLTSGLVGIGTSAPQALLHIDQPGMSGFDGVSVLIGPHWNNGVAYNNGNHVLGLYSWGGSAALSFATHNVGGYMISNSGQNLLFSAGYNAAGGEKMRIDSLGRVGIGTTTPQHLLHVAGTIGAEEIIVSSTGADYVFAPGYRLSALNEVQAYIQANHHLPDLPSADEIRQKGMDVGEMEAKLLAKIEELTLHMIDSERRMAQLSNRNQQLEREVDEMQLTLHRSGEEYRNRQIDQTEPATAKGKPGK